MKTKRLTHWLILISLGIILLILRNPDPLRNPVIYTEDGSWIGLALTKGWLYAFQNAKDGYFVWGNLLLLWASTFTSKLLCGNLLICLPYSIAFFSYLFFSSIATLAFFATREVLPNLARAALYLLLLLMPLGDSSNEILGRISNIGYLCVLASVLLIFIKLETRNSPWIDVLLLVCVATNPVCIPVILIYLLFTFLHQPKASRREWIYCHLFLIIGLCILTSWIGYRFSSLASTPVTGRLQIENLVEVVIARSILYPFLFWSYHSLSDFVVILIGVAWLALNIWLFRESNPKTKLFTGMVMAAFSIYLIFTHIMRQSLTQQLGGYKTTFPDRYFMGLNVLVLLAFVLLSGQEFKSFKNRNVARIARGTALNFSFDLCI